MGSARAAGDNRALEAVEASVTSLLLNHRDIRGAKNILLNISYGERTVTHREASTVRNYLQERTGWTANLIWGTAYKAGLGEELELTIVATGFPGSPDDVVSVPPPRSNIEPARPETGYGRDTGYEREADYVQGTRYTPQNDVVHRPAERTVYPQSTTPKVAQIVQPQAGTVQWKGTDRYTDIDALASTPAWVRRKATLANPYEGRTSGKTALKGDADIEKDDAPKPQPGTLFE
jgi:hypothetical protein